MPQTGRPGCELFSHQRQSEGRRGRTSGASGAHSPGRSVTQAGLCCAVPVSLAPDVHPGDLGPGPLRPALSGSAGARGKVRAGIRGLGRSQKRLPRPFSRGPRWEEQGSNPSLLVAYLYRCPIWRPPWLPLALRDLRMPTPPSTPSSHSTPPKEGFPVSVRWGRVVLASPCVRSRKVAPTPVHWIQVCSNSGSPCSFHNHPPSGLSQPWPLPRAGALSTSCRSGLGPGPGVLAICGAGLQLGSLADPSILFRAWPVPPAPTAPRRSQAYSARNSPLPSCSLPEKSSHHRPAAVDHSILPCVQSTCL